MSALFLNEFIDQGIDPFDYYEFQLLSMKSGDTEILSWAAYDKDRELWVMMMPTKLEFGESGQFSLGRYLMGSADMFVPIKETRIDSIANIDPDFIDAYTTAADRIYGIEPAEEQEQEPEILTESRVLH